MYPGGFPRHFEKKLISLYEQKHEMCFDVLHPFGGLAEYGVACDIKENIYPDVVADAHNLPFCNNMFDMVIVDPPYSKEEATKLYGTPYIKLLKCVQEAVRVAKIGMYIVLYHRYWIPKPKQTEYDLRIIVHPGQWHEARTCHVFRKLEN
jgi:tRNA G10  N-methylase Trm11